MEQIVCSYLGQLNIPISKKYVERLVLSHPEYPSMLSIADTLQRLGINYKAVRVGKEDIADIAFPYLLQPDHEGEEIQLIKDQQDIAAAHQSGKEYTQAIVLQAERTETIADEENNKLFSEETSFKMTSGFLVATLAGLLLLSIIQLFSWTYAALLITVIAGAIVGYLLIAKEIGTTYNTVESFCRAGQKVNCDAILKSDAARLVGKITLSDAAVTYFIFQLMIVGLFIPLLSGGSTFLWGLSILGALAIPIIGYSLYYQGIKEKTWCWLCLAVDALLVIQAALYGVMYTNGMIQWDSGNILISTYSVFLFITIGAAVLLVKSTLTETNRAVEREVLANRIKYDPSVFMSLLTRQEQINTTPFEQEPIIGKPDAPVKIVMAGSLSCGPCREGFKKAVQLVDTYPQKANVCIRFLPNKANNGQVTPGQYLLSYWQKKILGKRDESIRTKKTIANMVRSYEFGSFQKTVSGNFK